MGAPNEGPVAGVPKWTAMLTVGLGTFMGSLDNSIMNTVNPKLQQVLQRPLDTIQWVSTAYLVTVGALILSLGRLSDLVGRRIPYTVGFAVFTAGSALCGLAVDAEQLIAFRVVQAIGAALLFSNGPAVITEAFPATERGKALGIVGAIVGLGVTLGPPVGGLLCQYVGWRSIFYVNVPIGIVGSIQAWRVLRMSPPASGSWRDFDLPGAVCLALSLILLLLGLDHAAEELKAAHPWTTPPVLALLGAGTLLLTAFLVIEYRVHAPVLDLSLFRNRPFALAAASALLSYLAIFAVMFLGPNFLHTLARFSEARIGWLLTLLPLVMGSLAGFVGALSDRIGSRFLSSLGMAIAVVVLVAMAHFGPEARGWSFGLAFAGMGLAMALFQSPNTSTLMGTVRREQLGVASGTLATMRSLGMAIGIAFPVAVFVTSFGSLLPGVNPTEAAGGGAHPQEFIAAWHTTFLATAAVCTLAIVTSALGGLPKATAPPPEPAPAPPVPHGGAAA